MANKFKLQVYRNPSGEIFIENVKSNTCLRISSHGDATNITISGKGRFNPGSINGLAAIIITPK